MKKFLAVLLTLGLAACSSGSGGGGKPAPEDVQTNDFKAKLTGVWISECLIDEEARGYKQTLQIKEDGHGQIQEMHFNTKVCSGDVRRLTSSVAFTYTVTVLADGSAQMIQVISGEQKQLTIAILNNVMDVTVAGGVTRYIRQINAADPVTQAELDFTRLAKGIWTSRECVRLDQNTSAYIQLTIEDRGRALKVPQTYNNTNCVGNSRAGRQELLTYRVTEFSNNQGQILIGNVTSTVAFVMKQMTITDAVNGSVIYDKAVK